jgi:hypothetical protein
VVGSYQLFWLAGCWLAGPTEAWLQVYPGVGAQQACERRAAGWYWLSRPCSQILKC